jgi:coenzyme PQQ biosynthesis protein PqqD
MPLSSSSVPALWRLARVDFDPVRNRPVLLYPEGAVLLNDTGADILRLVDGTRTVTEIATILRDRYNADGSAELDQILADVAEYLSGLEARELIRDQ